MGGYQTIVEAQLGRAWQKGAIAGFFATGPMTIFMLVTQRFLPKGQRYALAPEMIIKELAHRAHMKQHMSKRQIVGATLVSHFGYGAGMGTLYGFLEQKLPLPAPVKGVLFGLVVWASSYLVMLPLISISAAGQKEPMRRNLLMMVAHVVWGACAGVGTAVLMRQRVLRLWHS